MSGWDKPPRGAILNRAHPLGNRFKGCWLFNEASGLYAHDYSGHGNHGTLTNMTEADWQGGNSGPALAFDGVNDYVDCGNDGSLEITTGAVGVWAKSTTQDAQQTIIDKNTNGQNDGDFTLHIDPTTNKFELRLQAAPSLSYTIRSNTAMTMGQWHHVLVTFGSGGMRMYVDGVLQDDTDAFTGGMTNTNANLNIGGFQTAYSFSGLMDGVCIWGGALSAAEVRWLYREPYDMFEFDNPVKYFLPSKFLTITPSDQQELYVVTSESD